METIYVFFALSLILFCSASVIFCFILSRREWEDEELKARKKDKTAGTDEPATQSVAKVHKRDAAEEVRTMRQRRGKEKNEELVKDLIDGKTPIELTAGEKNGNMSANTGRASPKGEKKNRRALMAYRSDDQGGTSSRNRIKDTVG